MITISELMIDIESTLNFYQNGKQYEWEGCSCHGHDVDKDQGARASNVWDNLDRLKRYVTDYSEYEEDDMKNFISKEEWEKSKILFPKKDISNGE
jgi:hypothetical protein